MFYSEYKNPISAVCRANRCGTDIDESDPVAWFELEEEWDEVDIRMQQCKTAKVCKNC